MNILIFDTIGTVVRWHWNRSNALQKVKNLWCQTYGVNWHLWWLTRKVIFKIGSNAQKSFNIYRLFCYKNDQNLSFGRKVAATKTFFFAGWKITAMNYEVKLTYVCGVCSLRESYWLRLRKWAGTFPSCRWPTCPVRIWTGSARTLSGCSPWKDGDAETPACLNYLPHTKIERNRYANFKRINAMNPRR